MPRKVLVADDIKTNRLILGKILSDEYEVLEAENGVRALEIIESERETLSAVLLDIMMPVMDGYEVLRRMRESAQLSQIPVIVNTGTSDADAEMKALTLGANDFITKPYNAGIVKRRLKNIINLRETAAIVNVLQKDELTGLWTRRVFFDKAAAMIAEKQSGYYIMACMNVNNFKVINDQYGTAKGDEVLCLIAERLTAFFGAGGGLICRMMADHFALLYPCALKTSSEIVALRRIISALDGTIAPISFSVGEYLIVDKSLSVSAMYDRATIAMNSVKGRVDVNIADYYESMRDDILREQSIVNEMETALAERQYEVWFQPQYNHSSRRLIGAEALVRWRHPRNGMISPGAFIPVFERNGFIYELDKYVWESACMYLRKWLDEGREVLPVSVNISRYDLLRDDLVDTICALTTKYSLPTELLRLEITESAFARSAERIVRVVKRFTAAGFVTEIDDFGSGYSSLNTLKDVPADILKLDMRFLENSENSQRGGNILGSIVRMAKWLGMSVIAEGVETVEQANYLRSIGCSCVQGYLYARPMPAEQYEILAEKAQCERGLESLDTVAQMDNNAFWDPKSIDSLVFNSYVGGACILEHTEDGLELLRVNEKYAQIICGAGATAEQALAAAWDERIDSRSAPAVRAAIAETLRTREEVVTEATFKSVPGKLGELRLRLAMRVVANAGDRALIYCLIDDMTAQYEAERHERTVTAQLSAIMENISGGISLVPYSGISQNAKNIYANGNYYAILGYTKAQFDAELPNGISNRVHPEDRRRLHDAFISCAETGKPMTAEFRAYRRSGEMIWLGCSGSVCEIAREPVFVSVMYDITMPKKTELRLAENDEVLRYLNDIARDLLSNNDSDAAINGALRKTMEFFGGQRAYVLEMDDKNAVARNTYEVCREGAPSILDKCGSIRYEDMPGWKEEYAARGYIAVTDAEALDDARAYERELLLSQGIRSLFAVPLKRDGEMIGIMGVDDPTAKSDVIERLMLIGDYMAVMLTRRDLSAHIRAGRDNIDALMQEMPGGFTRSKVLPDGTVSPVFANGEFAAMLGMSLDELRNSYHGDITVRIHPDDLEYQREAILRVLSGESRVTEKFRIMHKDGHYITVNITVRAVRNSKGELFVNSHYMI